MLNKKPCLIRICKLLTELQHKRQQADAIFNELDTIKQELLKLCTETVQG